MRSLPSRLADTTPRLVDGQSGPRGSVVGRLFAGPPWPLPRLLDSAVEGWWRLPVRLRTLGIAVLVVLVVFGIVRRTSRSPWGPDVAVVVATADGQAGQSVTAGIATRPADLVPDDALREIPEGRLAIDAVAGQVLTARHVVSGLPALLDDDEVAVALDQPLPPLPHRARLEVMGLALDGTGRRLASARLLTVTDEWTWLAVERTGAAAVTAALDTGGIRVVVAPSDPAATDAGGG